MVRLIFALNLDSAINQTFNNFEFYNKAKIVAKQDKKLSF